MRLKGGEAQVGPGACRGEGWLERTQLHWGCWWGYNWPHSNYDQKALKSGKSSLSRNHIHSTASLAPNSIKGIILVIPFPSHQFYFQGRLRIPTCSPGAIVPLTQTALTSPKAVPPHKPHTCLFYFFLYNDYLHPSSRMKTDLKNKAEKVKNHWFCLKQI